MTTTALINKGLISNMLVANRGEIARRIFRTCADLGIARTAVFSDADAASLHVAEADMSVRLPGNAPFETYLRPDLIIEAAHKAGADAVHPGYGFLSENAAFARAVVAAGLVWIGPPAQAVEAMGSKVAAKQLMDRAGVPVLPELDPSRVAESDLPVLVKASAGGGGRGMRLVRSLDTLADAVADAQAEAASAFGDSTVFCERFLETGRHIEVQVLADRHGTVWTLGERECSIQRRHQKVVEETPSPFVDETLRARLFDAARAAAKAIDYVGAGTVEFLVAEDGRFYFLEMNTRLQVEHPVTECVTGLDLVALQIRIAEGERLPVQPPQPRGHAIEVRVYAEDPAADWRPQSGTLHSFEVPGVDVEFGLPNGDAGLRLDSAVTSGSVVGVHYDALLAKVIAWAPDRARAARRLATALAGAKIHGPRTNRDMLVNILRHDAFLAGDTDTAFLDRHRSDTVTAPLAGENAYQASAIAAALAQAATNRENARVNGRLPSGWRNVPSAPQRRRYRAGDTEYGTEYEVAYRTIRDRYIIEDVPDIAVIDVTPDHVSLALDGVQRAFAVSRYPDLVCVDSALGPVTLVPVLRFTEPGNALATGSLTAQLPGTVLRIAVEVGQQVTAGEPLLWLEAMKMQHVIAALADGVVTELSVSVGQQVDQGAVLAVITPHEVKPQEPEL